MEAKPIPRLKILVAGGETRADLGCRGFVEVQVGDDDFEDDAIVLRPLELEIETGVITELMRLITQGKVFTFQPNLSYQLRRFPERDYYRIEGAIEALAHGHFHDRCILFNDFPGMQHRERMDVILHKIYLERIDEYNRRWRRMKGIEA